MLPTVTTLRDSLVKPLGKNAGEVFEKVFGLRTAGDLLRHYPRRYYTRGELTPLDSLHGDDHVTVLAQVADQPGAALPTIVVTAQHLNEERARIDTQTGASTYTFNASDRRGSARDGGRRAGWGRSGRRAGREGARATSGSAASRAVPRGGHRRP